MPRARSPVTRRRRHKKILRRAKGYFLSRSKLFKSARETVERALVYAYRDRKARKREFRRLWITRISAACRQLGMPYNQFIYGLKKAGVELDRKILSELAIHDPDGFKHLVDLAREQAA